MGEPNFGAYRRYTELTRHEPVTIIDGGKPGKEDDFITVEYDGFRGISTDETERLIEKFRQATAGTSREGVAESVLRAEIASAQNGELKLEENGGGANYAGHVYLDLKTRSYSELNNYVLGFTIATTAQQEKLADEFTREHEAAHQMLGVSEAGADYIASKRLLEKYPGPETREFLQSRADLRMIAPYRATDDSAGQLAFNYGYGTSIAIESALNSPAVESAEEMYDNAKIYDGLNGKDNKVHIEGYSNFVRPEIAVRQALLDVDPELVNGRYRPGAMSKAAQTLLDSGMFENGTPQRQILEELIDASKRIDRILPDQLAPIPKPALASTPVLAPGT